MEAWLGDPIVQASLAPFLAGLVVTLVLFKLRLGGLAAAAGFFATVQLASGLSFEPLTATRKALALGLVATAIGVLADFAFKARRETAVVLGVLFGAASAWVFWTVLSQKPQAQALLAGGGVALFVGWTVAWMASLERDAVRAGAAGLTLGLGAGVAAVMAASAVLGIYGMALGAASGAFLLVQMILGRRIDAGLTYGLSTGVLGAYVAAAAMMLASLGWIELGLLALVPLAVRLPVPAKWPVWAQALVLSLCGAACGGAAAGAAWYATRASG
jgi:hypothetical protein